MKIHKKEFALTRENKSAQPFEPRMNRILLLRSYLARYMRFHMWPHLRIFLIHVDVVTACHVKVD